MTPRDALIELLERLGASTGDAVLVHDVELNQWPAEAIKAMKSQKLITKSRPTASAICPGCERNCSMPVHTLPAKTGAPLSFIVCDKRSDVNRVEIPHKLLTQWQTNVNLVVGFVADSLGLRRSGTPLGAGIQEIGIATGNKRSQMLCLQSNGVLNLIVGHTALPLVELIEYHDGGYLLDGAAVRRMVDVATTADNRYTPNNARREKRKLDTQDLHESWQKAYRKLKKDHPNSSDNWISQKIARMDIAQGRNAETIRKNMKK